MAGAQIAAAGVGNRVARPTAYGWLVFALAFGLLISDYMARQVLNAVFPLIKLEWSLSDAQLGLLSGVVALMVGVLTFPLSMLADRWGRVKSLTLMAILWSLATLMCAAAQSYGQMLAGRVFVGVGEAAYGSVGIALVISVFPSSMRATLSSAFMAGGLFGQVLGVALGGEIAAGQGWRAAFLVIGLAGLVLAIAFPLLVSERRIAVIAHGEGLGGCRRYRARHASAAQVPVRQPLGGAGLSRERPSAVRRRGSTGLDTDLPGPVSPLADRPGRPDLRLAVPGLRHRHDPVRHGRRPDRARPAGPQDRPRHRLLPRQRGGPDARLAMPAGHRAAHSARHRHVLRCRARPVRPERWWPT